MNRDSEPYMPREELRHEIDSGVRFWGYEGDGELVGVMGIQRCAKRDVDQRHYHEGLMSRSAANFRTLPRLPLPLSHPFHRRKSCGITFDIRGARSGIVCENRWQSTGSWRIRW